MAPRRKTNLLSPGAQGEVSDMRTAPSGSWRSPITSDLIVKGLIGLGQIAIEGADIFWTEMRPSEKGRSVLVRRKPDGEIADVTPADSQRPHPHARVRRR